MPQFHFHLQERYEEDIGSDSERSFILKGTEQEADARSNCTLSEGDMAAGNPSSVETARQSPEYLRHHTYNSEQNELENDAFGAHVCGSLDHLPLGPPSGDLGNLMAEVKIHHGKAGERSQTEMPVMVVGALAEEPGVCGARHWTQEELDGSNEQPAELLLARELVPQTNGKAQLHHEAADHGHLTQEPYQTDDRQLPQLCQEQLPQAPHDNGQLLQTLHQTDRNGQPSLTQVPLVEGKLPFSQLCPTESGHELPTHSQLLPFVEEVDSGYPVPGSYHVCTDSTAGFSSCSSSGGYIECSNKYQQQLKI